MEEEEVVVSVVMVGRVLLPYIDRVQFRDDGNGILFFRQLKLLH